MNKTASALLLVVVALTLFATGVASAQEPQPPIPGLGSGNGFGVGFRAIRAHIAAGEETQLHAYMVDALAKALGISADVFESHREAGETAYQIALQLGIKANDIPQLLKNARLEALALAVGDNVITQGQADGIKSRYAGLGRGFCNGYGYMPAYGMNRDPLFQRPKP